MAFGLSQRPAIGGLACLLHSTRIHECIQSIVANQLMMGLSCRERRLFCDRKYPCTQCTSKDKECARASGLAPAKSFSRRVAYNTEPTKRVRIEQTSDDDDDHQDGDQAPTPAVSDNMSSSVDPIREIPAAQLAPYPIIPVAPVAPIAPIAPIALVADGIALMTRVVVSREARTIYESESPTLILFLEQVRKMWELEAIERITHVQIMVTVKMDMVAVVQAIDISLESHDQWGMAMRLARQNDKTAVVIVETSRGYQG